MHGWHGAGLATPPVSQRRRGRQHRGSEGQAGPAKSAAAPGAPRSSLRSATGRASLGLVAYTRTAPGGLDLLRPLWACRPSR